MRKPAESGGIQAKNKNPTQSCGEKCEKKTNLHTNLRFLLKKVFSAKHVFKNIFSKNNANGIKPYQKVVFQKRNICFL